MDGVQAGGLHHGIHEKKWHDMDAYILDEAVSTSMMKINVT
jgi:hypothetical protein